MILAWIGFIVLVIIGIAGIIAACMTFITLSFGISNKEAIFLILIQLSISLGSFYLAWTNSPFTIILG